MSSSIRKTIFIQLALFIPIFLTHAQSSNESKSTQDLSFLIGKWDIMRTYNPNKEQSRVLHGTLLCEESLDGQFINCIYEIERPGKVRGLDVVYFNYNSIYDKYESLWLSSTWPIKVLMQGELESSKDEFMLNTLATFPLEEGLTEYVKDELVANEEEPNKKSFFRKTFIRTSNDKEGVWTHHMNEQATLIIE